MYHKDLNNMLCVRFSDDTYKKLCEVASYKRISVSDVIRGFVDVCLADFERVNYGDTTSDFNDKL